MLFLGKELIMTKIFNSETRAPYIILSLVFIISIYPFFYMIMTSLMTAGEAINQYVFPRSPMFENYVEDEVVENPETFEFRIFAT